VPKISLDAVQLRAAANAADAPRQQVPMTFGDLLGAFSAQAVGHSVYMTKRYVAALGDVSAWSVTTAQLDGMAEALIAAGLKPSTVNRDMSMIGSAYRWAKAKRLHPAGFRSPTLECHRYKEDIRRVEVSRVDIDRLLAVSLGSRDARFAVYLHLLVDTGARRSEVLERHWRDIDLDARTLLAPTTKTGQPRVLHFQETTAALLRRRCPPGHRDRLIFEGRVPGYSIDFRAAFREAIKAAKLPGLRLHDLRHYVAADLLRQGVTVGQASQILGHSSQILMRRYGHLETEALAAAQARRWAPSTTSGITERIAP
jgi:integrase